MARIDLPDDGWAELLDPDDLTLRDVIGIKNAVKFRRADDSDGIEVGSGMGEQLEAAILAKVITSWSLPQPITSQAILGFRMRQLKPFRKVIDPYVRVVRGEDDPNPASGTETAST